MIDKWLKAGVVEDGLLHHTRDGTPQGGVISPMLSNIYLHHVLDEWVETEVKPRLAGPCTLVRFADDFVMTFKSHRDAKRVLEVPGKRLARYGLALHPDKTRIIDFRPARRGGPHPDCTDPPFDFLGFTHSRVKSRTGKNVVRQSTAKSRLARARAAVSDWSGDTATSRSPSSTPGCLRCSEVTMPITASRGICGNSTGTSGRP